MGTRINYELTTSTGTHPVILYSNTSTEGVDVEALFYAACCNAGGPNGAVATLLPLRYEGDGRQADSAIFTLDTSPGDREHVIRAVWSDGPDNAVRFFRRPATPSTAPGPASDAGENARVARLVACATVALNQCRTAGDYAKPYVQRLEQALAPFGAPDFALAMFDPGAEPEVEGDPGANGWEGRFLTPDALAFRVFLDEAVNPPVWRSFMGQEESEGFATSQEAFTNAMLVPARAAIAAAGAQENA